MGWLFDEPRHGATLSTWVGTCSRHARRRNLGFSFAPWTTKIGHSELALVTHRSTGITDDMRECEVPAKSLVCVMESSNAPVAGLGLHCCHVIALGLTVWLPRSTFVPIDADGTPLSDESGEGSS